MGSASLVPEFVNSELSTLIRGATCPGFLLFVPEMVALEFLLSLRGRLLHGTCFACLTFSIFWLIAFLT